MVEEEEEEDEERQEAAEWNGGVAPEEGHPVFIIMKMRDKNAAAIRGW